MALEKVFGRTPPESETVSFTANEMQFSVGAVEKRGLRDFNYIRLAADPEKKRIYFAFDKKAHPEAIKFYMQAGKSCRKMCSAAGLYKRYEWINKLRKEKADKRRFQIQPVDKSDKEAYGNYNLYIQL